MSNKCTNPTFSTIKNFCLFRKQRNRNLRRLRKIKRGTRSTCPPGWICGRGYAYNINYYNAVNCANKPFKCNK